MNNPSNCPVISDKKMFRLVCGGPNESVSLGLTIMNSAKTFIEKCTFKDFPNINALGIKFDLAIKYVKVNLDSSFVQTW